MAPLAPFLLLLLLPPFSSAEIKTLEISSDSRILIEFDKFGFTHSGHINISVSSVSFSSPSSPVEPHLMGFFIISDQSLLQAIYEAELLRADANSQFYCILDSSYITSLFRFDSLTSTPPSYHHSFPITQPDEYTLFFASCSLNAQVSMSVRTAMYNVDPDGSLNFLSVGRSRLPAIYSAFAVAYTAFLAYWIYVCLVKSRPFTHKIHLLMGLLLLAKVLNLVFAAEDLHYIRVSGTPHGWDVLFYLFQFLRGVLLFTVIVLIGTGWSFLKPFLQDREKKVLMIVIPLQVLANIASVVVDEKGESNPSWMTWKQVFLVVDIVCCCAVLFPIVWSIRTLKETSKTDGKAARNLEKLTLFRKFYIVVVGYLYFTRIVVYAFKTITSYKYAWVSEAASEVASLAFYVFMFKMFMPAERNQYFALDDDEEEAAAVALREEEFEL